MSEDPGKKAEPRKSRKSFTGVNRKVARFSSVQKRLREFYMPKIGKAEEGKVGAHPFLSTEE